MGSAMLSNHRGRGDEAKRQAERQLPPKREHAGSVAGAESGSYVVGAQRLIESKKGSAALVPDEERNWINREFTSHIDALEAADPHP